MSTTTETRDDHGPASACKRGLAGPSCDASRQLLPDADTREAMRLRAGGRIAFSAAEIRQVAEPDPAPQLVDADVLRSLLRAARQAARLLRQRGDVGGVAILEGECLRAEEALRKAS